MKEKQTDKTICKNVFQSGKNTPSKTQFTKMWVKLINCLERSKAAK